MYNIVNQIKCGILLYLEAGRNSAFLHNIDFTKTDH